MVKRMSPFVVVGVYFHTKVHSCGARGNSRRLGRGNTCFIRIFIVE